MSLTAGARLGSYEIRSTLGVGGMGEVYLAHDRDLGRDVAIKVLPQEVSTDPDRLARFEREARVLAALNHPKIAAIYGIEHVGDTRALVLELVDGPTLADRIFESAIPVEEALAIARQIADALEAAHGQGIVHRDLKPSNIKLRRDGVVKVLDFGLAKPTSLDSDADRTRPHGLSRSPTITSPAMLTATGVVLGTAAYMSPEQAKGQPVDKRSDIWAFGCLLYEMLSGRKPFASDDVTETMAFVLTKDPDWSALPAQVPGPVRTLLKRCLERDRHKRVGDVAAIRFVLDELGEVLRPAPQGDRAAFSRRERWAIAVAVIAVAAAIGALYRPSPTTSSPKPFTFSILPPEGHTFLAPSIAGAPSLSPDGRQIAYVASGPTGRQVWVQSLDAFDARPISGTEGASCPFWSYDRSWLGFLVGSGSELMRVNVTGGQPEILGAGGANARVCFGGSVNQNGTVLFYGGSNNTLASVSAIGAEQVQATERNISLFDENHMAPQFLPDGRHYLLQVRGGPDLQFQVWAGQLGSNQRQLLLKNVTNARYAPPPTSSGAGHLLYVRGRTLVAHTFDAQTLTLVGSPITIAQGVGVAGGGGLGDFDVSPTGVLIYRRAQPASNDLGSYDRAGKTVSAFGDREGNPRNNVRISPDGKWAAFTRMGDAVQDVWLADLTSGAISRFTLEGGRSPTWAPDGSQLVYLRDDTIYRKSFTGSATEVAVWSGPGTLAINDWSGDGKYLLLTRWDTSKPGMTGRGLWLLPNPLENNSAHEPVLFEADSLHGQFGPRIGPPRWVAFDERGEIFVKSMPTEPPAKWQVSVNGGNTSRWRADGGELFIVSSGSMIAAEIDPSSSRVRAFRTLFATPSGFRVALGQYAPGWDVSPDGSRFLTTVPAPDTPPAAITVVMNWQSMLK